MISHYTKALECEAFCSIDVGTHQRNMTGSFTEVLMRFPRSPGPALRAGLVNPSELVCFRS